MTIAMVFPGQGSQSQGMQADLAAEYGEVAETYNEASEILGYDLWELVQQGPSEKLAETTVTQPAMFTAGHAAWRCWKAAGGPQPARVAGHSLGEYTALVAAGSISFEEALRVVMRRSELMADAVPAGEGAVAAILGLDDDAIIAVCEDASGIGIAEPVNFNSPGQVVLAGHRRSIAHAVERAKEVGARRAIVLPISVPTHSSLMRGAGESLKEALAEAAFKEPEIPVFSATDGTLYTDADDIRARLSRQVYSHVHWVNTVTAMISAGTTSIIECGPGRVLTGLNKRIDRGTPVAFIDSPESLQKALQA